MPREAPSAAQARRRPRDGGTAAGVSERIIGVVSLHEGWGSTTDPGIRAGPPRAFPSAMTGAAPIKRPAWTQARERDRPRRK
jgi:hypothetical protein